jgi:hypothetical protein
MGPGWIRLIVAGRLGFIQSKQTRLLGQEANASYLLLYKPAPPTGFGLLVHVYAARPPPNSLAHAYTPPPPDLCEAARRIRIHAAGHFANLGKRIC